MLGNGAVNRWLDPFNAAMERFEINTPARIAAFLGQIAYESSALQRLKENLNYSRGLNELADDRNDDNDDEDFVSITVAINGGRSGLSERRRLWAQAKAIV